MHKSGHDVDTFRRRMLIGLGGAAVASSPLANLALGDTDEGISFAAGPRPLVQYPGKRPLIRVHTRPPHLETPFSVFDEGPITANDAFFVRYHLANFPLSIDLTTYRLEVKGHVNTPMKLSLDELKALGPHEEVIAVNQCSGNSRGYSKPRVFGAQLGNGAMGNARWAGIPLRSVLDRAGVRSGAKQVIFNGLDSPVLPETPDFRKSLDIQHALGDGPLLAWSMNRENIPFLNGYPLKLIVPGYFGTYWVKHLSEIEIIDRSFEGQNAFFMTKAYTLPDNACMCVAPGTEAAKVLPISNLPVRSFVTSVKAGDTFTVGRSIELKGIAFDSGTGIKTVAISIDGGATWRDAKLGKDLGRYSFREWRLTVSFSGEGPAQLMVRATSYGGESQPLEATWNHGGYRRHAVERTPITIA